MTRLVATHATILAAALLPAAGWAGLVVLVSRRARVPWAPLAAAFLWGATVAAFVATRANDALVALAGAGGYPALVPALLAPAVEEAAKATALVVVLAVWRGALAEARDGMTYGALAGLGFAATENLGYYLLAAVQGGTSGLVRALYLRGLVQGLNHAAFTATTGAAVGYAASARRSAAAVVGGFGVAVAAHALWNGVASGTITQLLCNAATAEGPCGPAPAPLDLLLTVPLLVATFVGPLAALIFVLVRASRSPAGRSA